MFDTLKAAREAGFRERKLWEYGGEEITVKGRLVVRNPLVAVSRTEWTKRGYCVRVGAQAHCRRSAFVAAIGRQQYDVYRHDQVDQVDPPKRIRAQPHKTASGENNLSAEQQAERRLSERLRMPVRELRALEPAQRQLLELLARSFSVDGKHVLDRANGLERRLFEYHSFFSAIRHRRQAHFFAGPTNSGKTHAALDKLAAAPRGIYLAPLRLMALEGQEALTQRGVRCSLITGEERDLVEGATHTSSTIEMLDPKKSYDVAVIDEIQLLADPGRGPVWTRALFGVDAPVLVLTGDPGAEPLLRRLAPEANLELQVTHFTRKNELRTLDHAFEMTALATLEPGTAFIAFSRRDVLELRNELLRAGHSVAALYGMLGPVVRRAEARRFRSGEAQMLVATDVIGMGLNLPINKLYFCNHKKYDGSSKRALEPWEVRQIAGRSGRFGHSEVGWVGGVGETPHRHICQALAAPPDPAAFAQAIAGPTLEHVESIATLVQESSITTILRFFIEHVRFSSSSDALRMGKLQDILINATVVDECAGKLPIAAKWTLACAPVPTGSKTLSEQDTFRRILSALNAGQSIGVNKACSLPPRLPKLQLGALEKSVTTLTIYVWVAFRYMDLLPERHRAEGLRDQVNARIAALLAKKQALPLLVDVALFSRNERYSAEDE